MNAIDLKDLNVPEVTAAFEAASIPELLASLAVARQQADVTKSECEAILEAARASAEYKTADFCRKLAVTMVENLTAAIKTRAATQYDGNKHPFAGVDIQEKQVAILTDEVQARKYAIEQAPRLISVDWKGLEKIAIKLNQTPAELRFYDVRRVPVATIAGDLAQYLPKAEEAEAYPF